MKKFNRLLAHELKNARSFTLIILAVLVISQTVQFIFQVRDSRFFNPNISGQELFESMYVHSGSWLLMVGGIALAILIYAFLIWHQEWNGKDRFIYRLGTLPGSRLPVGMAKFASILIIIMTVLLVQILLMTLFDYINHIFLNGTDPLYYPPFYFGDYEMLNLLMPNHIVSFIDRYLGGAAWLLIFMNATLIFENSRSNRFLGLVGAVLYLGLGTMLIAGIFYFLHDYFQVLPSEAWISILIDMLLFISQVFIMDRLLNKGLNV